jgi:hypothetical protein
MTTQTCSNDECTSGVLWFPQSNGEPRVIIVVGALAAAVWVLLTIPVLVAGYVRLRDDIRCAMWIGIWIAGVALMVLTYVAAFSWLDNNGPFVATEGTPWPNFLPAVAWGELPICAAWLALGAVMTRILAAPHSSNVPENSGRSTRQASS